MKFGEVHKKKSILEYASGTECPTKVVGLIRSLVKPKTLEGYYTRPSLCLFYCL